MSKIGHNSEVSAADLLRSIVGRVERLEYERQEVAEQIREVMREAKGCGFDAKVLRIVLKRRKMKAADRDEQDQMVELYEAQVGGSHGEV